MRFNVTQIVNKGLCTSCGVCAGSCPKDCISFKYGKERNTPLVAVNKCVNCGLCYDVCPGKGIELNGWSRNLFGNKSGTKIDECAGYYLESYTGHSMNHNIRMHSATGGMVTQFLIWLLKTKQIEGAVVVRYSKEDPLIAEPIIATNEDEIWESRSSKYVVLSVDRIAKDIANGKLKKIVVVGLPCQIQGWRQLAKKNRKIREAIIGYFAIYCSVNKTKHSIFYYPQRYHVLRNQIARFSFREDGCMGFMKFEDKEGNVLKKIPYLSYWFGTHSFFANPRCSLCIDQLGELADVSFGDIHIKPYSEDLIGTNSIITRSEKWDSLLKQCCKDGLISLDRIPIETLVSSQVYTRSFKKGAGVKANMMLRKIVGKDNPVYDYHYDGPVPLKCYMAEVIKAVMRFIGRYPYLWWIIRMLDRNKD